MKDTIINIEAKRVAVSLAPVIRAAANMAAKAVRSARARKAAETRRLNRAVREAFNWILNNGTVGRRALCIADASRARTEAREARERGDLAAAAQADERQRRELTEARSELHFQRWLYLDRMKRAGYAEDVARAAAPRLFNLPPELDPEPEPKTQEAQAAGAA